MKNLSIVLLLIFVSLFVVGGVMAQDMATLRQKSEETVKTKNPHRKLIKKYERDKQVTYLWGNEKTDLMLTIFYGNSEHEAVEKMRSAMDFFSVGPDKKLTGYGDEAYLWLSKGRESAAIRFRKANVYFDLSGPSRALVEDLAKKLADHVKK